MVVKKIGELEEVYILMVLCVWFRVPVRVKFVHARWGMVGMVVDRGVFCQSAFGHRVKFDGGAQDEQVRLLVLDSEFP